MSAGVKRDTAVNLLPGTTASYRFSLKVIGAIILITFGVGVILQLLGQPLYAGMTVALGVYLVLCSILFITIPLIVLDVLFD